MGRDKAFLAWHGRTLLDRALELARELTPAVTIVGQKEKFSALSPVIEDLYPGCGPLAGIHAALTSTTCGLNLVLAVDTPLLTSDFLRYLVQQADASGATVTAPRVRGKIQPLCTVYRREFSAVAETALRAERYKIEPLFEAVSRRILDEAELVKLAFDTRMFDNLNTPDEWERARGSGTIQP